MASLGAHGRKTFATSETPTVSSMVAHQCSQLNASRVAMFRKRLSTPSTDNSSFAHDPTHTPTATEEKERALSEGGQADAFSSVPARIGEIENVFAQKEK